MTILIGILFILMFIGIFGGFGAWAAGDNEAALKMVSFFFTPAAAMLTTYLLISLFME